MAHVRNGDMQLYEVPPKLRRDERKTIWDISTSRLQPSRRTLRGRKGRRIERIIGEPESMVRCSASYFTIASDCSLSIGQSAFLFLFAEFHSEV